MKPTIEQRFRNVSNSKTFQHIIKEFLLDQKTVLDMGCSNGEFLTHFGKGSVGLTLNPAEVEIGKVYNLDIRLGNAEVPMEFEKKFDAIFANNLFEHLYSPHAFLQTIKRYLEPGGVVILGVPCVPKITQLMMFKKFKGSLASAHINFFTHDTLRLTVERAGWDVSMVRGFRLSNPLFDRLFNLIYPHFYVAATVREGFNYSNKRQKELEGYKGTGILP